MKGLIFLLTITGFFSLQSCDYVTMPYPKKQASQTLVNAVVKKVLIEEYTASQCVNCPRAAAEADLLRNNNKGKVITVSVHCSSLADPLGTNFPYNFHTPAGDNYNALYVDGDATGLPSGMIDRISWQPGTGFPKSDQDFTNHWPSYVATELAAPDSVYLQISNTYTASTRQLNCLVKTKFLTPLLSSYNLVVLMTEDSIPSPQKDIDSTNIRQNFMHRYVLRGAIDGHLNGTGIPITLPASPISGDSIMTPVHYTIPASFPSAGLCNDKHCYVVAFFYDTVSGDILQVEEQKVW
jgi:hypothetical protein